MTKKTKGRDELTSRDIRRLIDKIEWPPFPEDSSVKIDPAEMDIPDNCKAIAKLGRTEGLQIMLRDRSHIRAVGLGLKTVGGQRTDEYALQFFVRKKLRPERKKLIPKTLDNYPVDVLELPGDIFTLQQRFPTGSFTRQSGAVAGSSITNEDEAPDLFDLTRVPAGLLQPDPPGGTLGGTFQSLGGSGQRGVTNAHVALNQGIDALLSNFPASILTLLTPPRGERMTVSGGPNIGQSLYQLMEIDTFWPMLVPTSLFPAPGILSFLYVDVAAGDVNLRPQPLPAIFMPPPPPPQPDPRRMIVTGDRIAHALPPLPGFHVYKVGRRTGITWGDILASFVQFAIPAGPAVVIFDQVICSLVVDRGDSGSSLLRERSHEYLGSIWGGFGRGSGIGLATPPWWVSLFGDLRLF